LDRDERLFIEGIKSRARKLIRHKIWDGIDEGRVTAWLQQFEARNCELLGACLLDSFIFRNRAQVEALLRVALTSPDVVSPQAICDEATLFELARRGPDPGIRLAPVIRLDQPPTKSGCYVLRRLAKSLRIHDKWMVWPQKLRDAPNSLHTIILVDDFCGSGSQFSEFVELTDFKEVMASRPHCRVLYITVAAHASGIANVIKEFPRVKFIPGEILGPEHSFFTGSVLDRIKIDGIANRLKNDYDKIANDVGLGGGIGHYGFDSQGLTYAFEHGTPNNSLPIYWYQNDSWTSLVNR
jgi:hypothetical protein